MAHSSMAADASVASVGLDAIGDSLRRGWRDFLARPTVAIFVIVIYPFVGLLLYRFTFDEALLPLLFPMASGFALVGPITAAGLYEISRRRERGGELDGVTAFRVLSTERLIPLIQVGVFLLVIYAAWIGVAQLIYGVTMGDYVPSSLGDLLARAFGTAEGWALIVVGCGVGFCFALAALAVGAISLPAIIDKGLPAGEAVGLSVSAFASNSRTMLAWGLVVAAGLVLGTLPFFLGLVLVLPIFGHATWHLYRRLVPPDGDGA